MRYLSLLLLTTQAYSMGLGVHAWKDDGAGACRPGVDMSFSPGLSGTWNMPASCTTAQVNLKGAGGGGGGLGDSTVGSCSYGFSGGGKANSPDGTPFDYGYQWCTGVADAYLKNGATTVAQAATGKGGHGGDSDSCFASIGGAAGTTAGTVPNKITGLGSNGGARGATSGTCWTIGATSGSRGDWVYGTFTAASGTAFSWAMGTTDDGSTQNGGWSFDANCVGSAGSDPVMVISWPAYH